MSVHNNPVYCKQCFQVTVQSSTCDNFLLSFTALHTLRLSGSHLRLWVGLLGLHVLIYFIKDQQLILTANIITSFSLMHQLSSSHQCSITMMEHRQCRYSMWHCLQAPSMVSRQHSLVQNSQSKQTKCTKMPNCLFLTI